MFISALPLHVSAPLGCQEPWGWGKMGVGGAGLALVGTGGGGSRVSDI